MNYTALNEWHESGKEQSLSGRYITLEDIVPLLDNLPNYISKEVIGHSVENRPIYSITMGSGPAKILGWSQMHGNESTTTKAIFDIISYYKSHDAQAFDNLLKRCTICLLPMLNPDGAQRYTRLNANLIDLNRDAQDRSQPESVVLRAVYKTFKPDFCLNLHGQRTIFGVGNPPKSATVSFLSPSQDELRTVTLSRKRGMEIITGINTMLQGFIPGGVGRYDDGFNINCVGDTFQALNTPTILFEAGHYPEDYKREITRRYIFLSLVAAFDQIGSKKSEISNFNANDYFQIPENEKNFCDIIIRNLLFSDGQIKDLAIQYEETLVGNSIAFNPKILSVGNPDNSKGHREFDAQNSTLKNESESSWETGVVLKEIKLNSEIAISFSLISDNIL